ncbi:MAG: hypothetical protein IJ169_04475 [Paludibacteraceae bacterium]|nr:hypothetical protein [Paludibacteraceae bacterium]
MANIQKQYDICVITGKYRDQMGQEKNRYTRVGVHFVYDDGSFSSRLETLPVIPWSGSLYYFERKEQPASSPVPVSAPGSAMPAPPMWDQHGNLL